jgi:sugar O-acyltransferase (sialic acid O-acetyltransferase NeuD family)
MNPSSEKARPAANPAANPLVIIGAGGFGREVLAWARHAEPGRKIKGFIDDNLSALNGFTKNLSVVDRAIDYLPDPLDVLVCAVAEVELKRRWVNRMINRGGAFARLIHPTVILGENVQLGTGVILCHHTVVSSDARIGDYVSVDLHSTVAHDAVIGRWSRINRHVDIMEGAVLGEGVTVGSHACIMFGVKIGDGAVVGPGAVVAESVAAGATVQGPLARPAVGKKEAVDA